MKRLRKFILIGLILILAIPIQMQCGNLFYGCATAPGPDGIYYTYYEVEPLGITLIETLTRVNLYIYYWSGEQAHSIAR